jgi:hypothetical protein
MNPDSAVKSSTAHLHDRVAALAYSIYERRGCQHGHDVEDWIQAEKAILEEIASRQYRNKIREKL